MGEKKIEEITSKNACAYYAKMFNQLIGYIPPKSRNGRGKVSLYDTYEQVEKYIATARKQVAKQILDEIDKRQELLDGGIVTSDLRQKWGVE